MLTTSIFTAVINRCKVGSLTKKRSEQKAHFYPLMSIFEVKLNFHFLFVQCHNVTFSMTMKMMLETGTNEANLLGISPFVYFVSKNESKIAIKPQSSTR